MKRRRKSDATGTIKGSTKDGKKKAGIRIEHLNYKVRQLSSVLPQALTFL